MFTTTYLQYLCQQKLSKQHIKQINVIHVTPPTMEAKINNESSPSKPSLEVGKLFLKSFLAVPYVIPIQLFDNNSIVAFVAGKDDNSDHIVTRLCTIGTASANSAKFHGIKPRTYIEDLLL